MIYLIMFAVLIYFYIGKKLFNRQDDEEDYINKYN